MPCWPLGFAIRIEQSSKERDRTEPEDSDLNGILGVSVGFRSTAKLPMNEA
jgi:hypothetical protein